jgi:HSP20 family protein
MRPTRWQSFSPLWNQLQQLQGEMNRVFDRWTDGGSFFEGFRSFPPVNVWEEADHVFVESELPGMDFKDLEIFVTAGNQLTIKGERNSPRWRRACGTGRSEPTAASRAA